MAQMRPHLSHSIAVFVTTKADINLTGVNIPDAGTSLYRGANELAEILMSITLISLDDSPICEIRDRSSRFEFWWKSPLEYLKLQSYSQRPP